MSDEPKFMPVDPEGTPPPQKSGDLFGLPAAQPYSSASEPSLEPSGVSLEPPGGISFEPPAGYAVDAPGSGAEPPAPPPPAYTPPPSYAAPPVVETPLPPAPPAGEKKSGLSRGWIIAIVVIVVLCCLCCLALGVLLWFSGDSILQWFNDNTVWNLLSVL